MYSEETRVSDLLILVTSSEIQRGKLAESRHDRERAILHLMAAGHLKLVLARDYEQAGEWENSVRSLMSAAWCLWRGGDMLAGRRIFDELRASIQEKIDAIDDAVAELETDSPGSTTIAKL